MTHMQIFILAICGIISFKLMYSLLGIIGNYLEKRIKQKDEELTDSIKRRDSFEIMIKNTNSKQTTLNVFGGVGTVEINNATLEAHKLNSLQDKFKGQIKPTDTVIDKVQRSRMLASVELKNNNSIMLKIICYGFAKSEYWELVEGIKLAFNDKKMDFKVPENIDELNALYEQQIYSQVND